MARLSKSSFALIGQKTTGNLLKILNKKFISVQIFGCG
ncbi:hypothetical protein PSPO_a2733 [Pseudoalteromonas spongiae UST010723-006]|nr:hypothetical protein PSPO_a2733 [Pseudoalteromonas spongiae UST010723-006]